MRHLIIALLFAALVAPASAQLAPSASAPITVRPQ
jgi:hypothetical protein